MPLYEVEVDVKLRVKERVYARNLDDANELAFENVGGRFSTLENVLNVREVMGHKTTRLTMEKFSVKEFLEHYPHIHLIGPHTVKKMEDAWEFAVKNGLLEKLVLRLEYLDTYAGDRLDHVNLHADNAPHSFEFGIFARKDGGPAELWFNGGLIFHPAGSSGVQAPELAVRINDPSESDWEIHT